MNIWAILTEPAIIIIFSIFAIFVIYVLTNYIRLEKNLKRVYLFLSSLNKKEISYRYNQLNEFMSENSYVNTIWEDFKKALVFPEKIYTAVKDSVKETSSPEVFLTVDSSYFFNEDSLIYTKINYKYIQSMPTLLTGLGPFFTFLKMALAFAAVNVVSSDSFAAIDTLISNIQIAALCSVFAVGFSLIFMFFEKVFYNKKCKRYCLKIQKELIRLFDVCTGEQFLLDMVKELKSQNSSTEKIFKSLPEDIAKTLSKSISEVTSPYLENILYGLNKLNERIGKNSGGDIVDKLF